MFTVIYNVFVEKEKATEQTTRYTIRFVSLSFSLLVLLIDFIKFKLIQMLMFM